MLICMIGDNNAYYNLYANNRVFYVQEWNFFLKSISFFVKQEWNFF